VDAFVDDAESQVIHPHPSEFSVCSFGELILFLTSRWPCPECEVFRPLGVCPDQEYPTLIIRRPSPTLSSFLRCSSLRFIPPVSQADLKGKSDSMFLSACSPFSSVYRAQIFKTPLPVDQKCRFPSFSRRHTGVNAKLSSLRGTLSHEVEIS